MKGVPRHAIREEIFKRCLSLLKGKIKPLHISPFLKDFLSHLWWLFKAFFLHFYSSYFFFMKEFWRSKASLLRNLECFIYYFSLSLYFCFTFFFSSSLPLSSPILFSFSHSLSLFFIFCFSL